MASKNTTICELEVEVEASFEEGEEQTWEHPGSSDCVYIEHVWLSKGKKQVDILEFLSDEIVESLEEEMLDHFKSLADEAKVDAHLAREEAKFDTPTDWTPF